MDFLSPVLQRPRQGQPEPARAEDRTDQMFAGLDADSLRQAKAIDCLFATPASGAEASTAPFPSTLDPSPLASTDADDLRRRRLRPRRARDPGLRSVDEIGMAQDTPNSSPSRRRVLRPRSRPHSLVSAEASDPTPASAPPVLTTPAAVQEVENPFGSLFSSQTAFDIPGWPSLSQVAPGQMQTSTLGPSFDFAMPFAHLSASTSISPTQEGTTKDSEEAQRLKRPRSDAIYAVCSPTKEQIISQRPDDDISVQYEHYVHTSPVGRSAPPQPALTIHPPATNFSLPQARVSASTADMTLATAFSPQSQLASRAPPTSLQIQRGIKRRRDFSVKGHGRPVVDRRRKDPSDEPSFSHLSQPCRFPQHTQSQDTSDSVDHDGQVHFAFDSPVQSPVSSVSSFASSSGLGARTPDRLYRGSDTSTSSDYGRYIENAEDWRPLSATSSTTSSHASLLGSSDHSNNLEHDQSPGLDMDTPFTRQSPKAMRLRTRTLKPSDKALVSSLTTPILRVPSDINEARDQLYASANALEGLTLRSNPTAVSLTNIQSTPEMVSGCSSAVPRRLHHQRSLNALDDEMGSWQQHLELISSAGTLPNNSNQVKSEAIVTPQHHSRRMLLRRSMTSTDQTCLLPPTPESLPHHSTMQNHHGPLNARQQQPYQRPQHPQLDRHSTIKSQRPHPVLRLDHIADNDHHHRHQQQRLQPHRGSIRSATSYTSDSSVNSPSSSSHPCSLSPSPMLSPISSGSGLRVNNQLNYGQLPLYPHSSPSSTGSVDMEYMSGSGSSQYRFPDRRQNQLQQQQQPPPSPHVGGGDDKISYRQALAALDALTEYLTQQASLAQESNSRSNNSNGNGNSNSSNSNSNSKGNGNGNGDIEFGVADREHFFTLGELRGRIRTRLEMEERGS